MNSLKNSEDENLNNLVEMLESNNYSKKNFAIYGIGAVAKNLIDILTQLNLVGLIDKDLNNIGKIIYGLEVLSNEVIIDKVDIIIIAANRVYWETIFQRISYLENEYGIEILFLNGQKGKITMKDVEISNNPYWENNINKLKHIIDEHEIISFDIFDTLVARKVARPEDMLSIVEYKVNRIKELSDFDFLTKRKEAEEVCRQIYGECLEIDQIYDQIQVHNDLTNNIATMLKQLEIETELECAVARKDVLEAYHYCIKENKKVYLISDIHLNKENIILILKKFGIKGYTNIFISCDMKMSKINGQLWEYFYNLNIGKKCLHIGDNQKADIINPKKYGINTFKVMNSYDMMLSSTIKDVAINIHGLNDSILTGLFLSRLFNSPFALNKYKGKPVIDDLFNFGYLFFGPLILSYFIWLIKETRKDEVDKILFLAREGFSLEKLYSKIVKTFNVEKVPEAIYFKTSRRMALVPSIRTKEDIYEALENSFSGTLKELLFHRFGLVCEDEIGDKQITNLSKEVLQIIEKYEKEILEIAKEERKNYLKYIDSLKINNNKKIGLADTGVKGTIQYYLSKFIDAEFIGYYFTAYTGANNPYSLGEKIKALYPETLHSNSSNMLKYHILFESTLAAPEGMYIKLGSDGKFINGPIFSNQKIFKQKQQIHKGIEAFIMDVFELNKDLFKSPMDKNLIDELYGLPLSGKVIIESSIKDTFYVDDLFGVNSEKKIWD